MTGLRRRLFLTLPKGAFLIWVMVQLLESYDVVLCETSPGCVFDVPRAAQC
jgi:hypothetical protein